jgi:hypothetical protein
MEPDLKKKPLSSWLMLVSYHSYSSILKIEAICPSDFQCYIPEDKNFYNHRCENFKSYKAFQISVSYSTECSFL